MSNNSTIKKLLIDGWKFYWDKECWYVGANHPNGGKTSVCEIKPHWRYDFNEVGQLLADALNKSIEVPVE